MPRVYSYATQLERERAALARAQEQQANAREKERRRADRAAQSALVERRQHEADEKTADVQEQMTALESFLASRAAKFAVYALDFDRLKRTPAMPKFDAGGLDAPLPEPVLVLPLAPNFLVRLIPPLMRRHEDAVAAAMRDHDAARARHAAATALRAKQLESRKEAYGAACDRVAAEAAAQNKEIDDFREDYRKCVPEAVDQYFELVLGEDRLPEEFPQEVRAAYAPDAKQLVVERQMPTIDAVPESQSFRYVKSGDRIEAKARPQSLVRAVYASFVAQFALATAYVVYKADEAATVDVLVLNCYVDTIDPATGKAIRPCLLSFRVTRDALAAIDLSKVEPTACLRSLGARVSPSPHELVPVQPVVNFKMVDPRFIDKRDVLDGLDQRPNLAGLTPSDFEALMTNLFEKMGLETRLTRPSRDGGVDCVAWDKREILGGKVVVQAKRYRHTVGVGAVRDLYGTMINEGAAKGILVTTSHYGKSAYEFAQNKPLELLTGENLIYMLKQYADVDAKIEFADDWNDPVPDSPELPAEAVDLKV
ncbi:MAG TPA: restriction endonuclease [Candidatus Eremiobacteraceae bacterium]|nr:restriction endonuclease [Candidatus Eremiobacteraceae bacterium]